MQPEKRVKDLMSPIDDLATIPADATVREAVALLARNQAQHCCDRRILVTDAGGKPVGLFSAQNLMRAVEPRLLEPGALPDSIAWIIEQADPKYYPEGTFTRASAKQASRKVRELAEPWDETAVNVDAPLMKAVHLMVRNCLGTLPVVDTGRLVGVIHSSAITGEIAAALAPPEAGVS